MVLQMAENAGEKDESPNKLRTYNNRCAIYILQHIWNLWKQKWHLHIVIAYAAFYGHAKCGICPDHVVAAYFLANFKFADRFVAITYQLQYLKYDKELLLHM